MIINFGSKFRGKKLIDTNKKKEGNGESISSRLESGISGIKKDIKTGKWNACPIINGKRVLLGLHNSISEAEGAIKRYKKGQKIIPLYPYKGFKAF